MHRRDDKLSTEYDSTKYAPEGAPKFAPKCAIVTGGSRGIGRAVVDRLLEDGFAVVSCARGARPVDLNPRVLWLQSDVAIPENAKEVVAAACSEFGRIDVLVNNAGVQVEKDVLTTTDDDWDSLVNTNCRGVFNMCRAVIPVMTSAGNEDQQGNIVNIGSISGKVADPCMALYNASKAFVHGLTRSIAVDHGPAVRCNAIAPGWIMTAMADDAFALANDPAAARADALQRHPAGRFGKPEDIASCVSWLVGSEATYVTGQCFTIDGGLTAASPLQPGLS